MNIWEERPALVTKPKAVKTKPKVDHSAAWVIYEAYKVKREELTRHQEYATRVEKATAGRGQTPVMPLATMGCNSGPLLCDWCNKPIVLEGGKFHNVYADAAWAANPDPKWVSWIKGGMVVEIVENDTVRIYHGYESQPEHCCSKARVVRAAMEQVFVKDLSRVPALVAFLEDEFKSSELLSDIVRLMFSFDPGLGVNHP